MVWKSNLNDIDTEVLDETAGIKASAASNPRAGTAPNNQAPRPASQRAKATGLNPSSSRQKIQTSNAPSPTKSVAQSQMRGASPSMSAQKPQMNLPTGGHEAYNADQQFAGMNNQQPGGGVTGSGEELALTLEKVVSQLDIISRTLHVLEQRVSMNEESVQNCLNYFHD